MRTRRGGEGNRTTDGSVRIIGGKWRGRKLAVAPLPHLRPSPDRVRETLFNWLAPYISGAQCLDLFAGTGALGFEAVSRGAAGATLLERDPRAVEFIHRHIDTLGAESVSVIERDTLGWLRAHDPEPFDIVFMDPPFGQGLVDATVDELKRGWLKHRAWVYLEAEKIPILHLQAAGWQLLRQGQTRQVHFALVEINTRPPG